MGVKTKSTEPKYTFRRKAGRSIVDHKPVFSPDGESVLLIVENIVRVYNVATGDCTRLLETEKPVTKLIDIHFPENGTNDLFACSNDGIVTTWTWENGAVLRETELQLPDNYKVVTFNIVDDKECFVTASSPENRQLYLASYSTKTGELIYEFADTKIYHTYIIRVSLGICNGDKYAAITNATKLLYIQNLHQPHLHTTIINSNHFRILAVSAHNKESAVAITDTLGRLTIIRGYLYDYRNLAKEVLHWHFLPPMAVCFSLQGNYVFSGGMEKVAVKWTLGDLSIKANEKNFIPRLPGMIRFITTNNTHVAISLTNNSVVIANAQMRITSTILECGGLSPVARAISSYLVYHRPLGSLLLGGRTGHLQVYSTTTDKVLYNIDITQMNSIPSERHNLLPLETEITCATVSPDGAWLATSEYRNDGITYPEEKLKFWIAVNKADTPFKLNTCVNLSHGGCNVVSLAFNNKGEICISAGLDQKFRIWKKEVSDTQNNKISWNCLTACYYSSGVSHYLSHGILNKFKNGVSVIPGKVEDLSYMKMDGNKNDVIHKLFNVKNENFNPGNDLFLGLKRDDEYSMGGVAVSQDGSLIAAWFGSKLTLWDTHLCNMRTSLSHPSLRPRGVDVKFGNNDAAHYLVCTTYNYLAVWSLLSLTVKWLVEVNPTCLTADPFSNKMAVVTRNNDVIIFNPMSSKPILHEKQVLNPNQGVLKQCCFGTLAKDDIRLYTMRNDSEIYCLEREETVENRLEVITRRNVFSKFSALLAEKSVSEVKSAATVDLTPEIDTTNAVAHFLSAAPHMLPPVGVLTTAFLQHLSGQQEQEEQEENPVEIEVDQSSDDEVITNENSKSPPKPTQLWTADYEMVKEKRLKRILQETLLDSELTVSVFSNK